VLLAVLFAVSLPAVTARLYSSDEVQYFSYLRSLYFDRDVSFENEYRYFYDRNIAQSAGYHETFLERETAVGRRVNYATLGAAILWSPFYAAADLWTRLSGRAEANGFTQPYISAVAYGSAFYAFLAVLLSIRAARLILGRDRTFLAGAAVWLGTPLLFYMYVAPPFAHACSAFAAALFVNVWLHVRRTWSPAGTFALGLCVALMAMVREQDGFLAVGPAVDFARWLARDGRWKMVDGRGPDVAAAGAGIAGTAIGYIPQLLAYNALNGYPGPAEHVARKMYWYSPHALQVLASPNHGFFFWTPLAVIAIAGLAAMAMARGRLESAPTDMDSAVATGVSRPVPPGADFPGRPMAFALLVMVASQVYVAGSVESWTVAGAFGQRRFVCLTVVLAIGLAAAWRAFDRRTVTVLVALCVWWNVALMAQFATRLMDRQRLEPARNAYHAFVTLPLKLPALAYRYFTDRASFYESTGAGGR